MSKMGNAYIEKMERGMDTKDVHYQVDSQGRAVIRVPEKDVAKYLSAPDLYEALVQITVDWGKGDIEVDHRTRAMIAKALAKAEGK